MNYASRFKWGFRSLVKNLLKGKFKSLFRLLVDPKYREDIKYMITLVRSQHRTISHGQVSLQEIAFGHDINYPNYVAELVHKNKTIGWKKLKPIKVVWDYNKGCWLVVDGNHRLASLKMTLPKYVKIPVFILRGPNEKPLHYEQYN